MIRVRFAPASTGSLTLSGARVALANHLYACQNNGRMLLRLDDLDEAGSSASWAEQIRQDLHWLSIDWQDLVRQSDRLSFYQSVIERLKREELLYPCFESEEELKAKLEFRRKRNQIAIYDRAMLSLTAKQRHDAEAGGKSPYWRLKLSDRMLEWTDLISGQKQVALSTVSDPILVRSDGRPTPMLTSVVDDLDFGTTHILRAEDNQANAAIQIELFEILTGARSAIRFGHLPALNETSGAENGERRMRNLALRALRTDGIEPHVVAACLIGANTTVLVSPMELARDFRLDGLAKARFDVKQMLALNRQALSKLKFETVVDRLPGGATEAFWLAVTRKPGLAEGSARLVGRGRRHNGTARG